MHTHGSGLVLFDTNYVIYIYTHMHVYIDMPLSYADHQSVNFLSALGEHAPTLTTVQSWNHSRRREKAWSRWPAAAFSQHVSTRVCLKMGYISQFMPILMVTMMINCETIGC